MTTRIEHRRWYISGVDENGKVAFMGKWLTEEEAIREGGHLFPNQLFKTHHYPTMDYKRAKAMWRMDRARVVGLGVAMRPVRSTVRREGGQPVGG